MKITLPPFTWHFKGTATRKELLCVMGLCLCCIALLFLWSMFLFKSALGLFAALFASTPYFVALEAVLCRRFQSYGIPYAVALLFVVAWILGFCLMIYASFLYTNFTPYRLSPEEVMANMEHIHNLATIASFLCMPSFCLLVVLPALPDKFAPSHQPNR